MPKLNILWDLKSKIKKLYWRNYILDNFINEKIRIPGVFLWKKDPDPGKYRIRVTQKDRIRPDPDPDPDPQHYFWDTLIIYWCR